MISTLFHEKEHRDKGQGYASNAATNFQHADIYAGQIEDATFKPTTKDFKADIINSAGGYLADAYNNNEVQSNELEVTLNGINNSIAQFGLELVSTYTMGKVAIKLYDTSEKNKKDEKKRK